MKAQLIIPYTVSMTVLLRARQQRMDFRSRRTDAHSTKGNLQSKEIASRKRIIMMQHPVDSNLGTKTDSSHWKKKLRFGMQQACVGQRDVFFRQKAIVSVYLSLLRV